MTPEPKPEIGNIVNMIMEDGSIKDAKILSLVDPEGYWLDLDPGQIKEAVSFDPEAKNIRSWHYKEGN